MRGLAPSRLPLAAAVAVGLAPAGEEIARVPPAPAPFLRQLVPMDAVEVREPR